MWSDDPVADYAKHDAEQQRWLESRPRCTSCGQPITDETLYVFDEDILCYECLNKHHRKWTSEYCSGREENY